MKKVLVLLAQGYEELEAVTVIDLLRRANNQIITTSLIPGPVTGARRTVLLPDTSLDLIQDYAYDMLVLPGGQPGTDTLLQDPRVIQLVRTMHEAGRYIAAICAAPKVLAKAGILKGKRMTAFPGALNTAELATMTYLEDSVVQDGHIITSRGPGTAMDFALCLIEVLNGNAISAQVEAALQRPIQQQRPQR